MKQGEKDKRFWKRAIKVPKQSDYKHLSYSVTTDGITIVTLKRPERLNSFNKDMKEEFRHAIWEKFKPSFDEKVLVITGSGTAAFSTGEDLSAIDPDWTDSQIQDYARETLILYHQIVKSILLTTKPIIAALNGTAAGAGLSIALACDERFAIHSFEEEADKIKTHYFLPAFTNFGFIPDSGITATLPRLIGEEASNVWLFSDPRFRISYQTAKMESRIINSLYGDYDKMMAGVLDFTRSRIFSRSPVEYKLSKMERNRELVERLTRRNGVFDWEINAQTSCLLSDFTRAKIREFQNKSNK